MARYRPRNVAQRGGSAQGARASVQSLPAPVGGWNARDSFANMDPLDAVQLTNMFPNVSNVVLRGGYSQWATGLSGQVQTLMTYAAGAVSKLFAVTSSGNIYDVTSSGPVGAPEVTGLSSGYGEHTNITTTGGSFLYYVNGLDKPLLYDGSSWIPIDALSTPAITGVTTTTLSNVVLFKNRVWFIQKDTLIAWYLPTSSVGGAAQQLPLSSIARQGGALVDFDAWTVDAGYGVDDNLAFITDQGELILYAGTDPASITTWSLIGVWQFGTPIGNRCMLKYGGDLLVLTQDGLFPMAGSLQSSRLDPRVALSDKIQGAITSATSAYSGLDGWEIHYNARNNAIWVNVPAAVGYQQQYAMNTITKAWAQFTGWAANCWETFGDEPYFGANGYVAKAWDSTYADDGNNIDTIVQQAFNYFGSRGEKKQFTRAHISVYSDGTPSVGVGMNVDFSVSDTTAPLNFTPSAAALWGSGVWGLSLWGTGATIQNIWLGIAAYPGYCGSLRFQSASQGLQIGWASTDVVFEIGGAGM